MTLEILVRKMKKKKKNDIRYQRFDLQPGGKNAAVANLEKAARRPTAQLRPITSFPLLLTTRPED
jgi:hypothetical protein